MSSACCPCEGDLEDGEAETAGISSEHANRVKSRYVARNLSSFSNLFQSFWKEARPSERARVLQTGVVKDGRNYVLEEDVHVSFVAWK